MPTSYGLSEGAGPKTWEEACQRLQVARNYWLCTSSRDGRPHVVPIWACWFEESLCFGTAANSAKARNLRANPACCVHLESGDQVLILHATAQPLEGPSLDEVDGLYRVKYAVGLREAPGELSFFRLRPNRALAWDEQDFPTSATAWNLAVH